jgi:uncharacterized membrane protein
MSSPPANPRLPFIDALRGLVIMLMLLDHVRSYFGPANLDPLDLAHSTPLWFMTRWVTHLCAPLFIILAGTGSALYGQRVGKAELARYLVVRGLLLIALEATLFSLSFGFLPRGVLFFQVMWVLGICMILLAGLIYLPRPLLWALALVGIFGHNLLDGWHASDFGTLAPLWQVWHERGFIAIGGAKTGIFLLYPVLPWISVMLLGYLLAPVMQRPATERERLLLWGGLGLLLLLVLLRWPNMYGNPKPWMPHPDGWLYSFLAFINLQKYPPSLLYLCATLGIGSLLLALFARYTEQKLHWLLVPGRVPLFFYICHLPALALGRAGLEFARHLITGQPFSLPTDGGTQPPDLSWSPVLQVYGVWLVYSVLLWLSCRWYGKLKRERPRAWMRYV